MSTVDRSRIPFAVDRYGKWVDVRLTGIENPHVLVVGGSQTGKTTTEKVIAAAAGARGCIVPMIDPKQRFAKVMRDPDTHEPLPHMPVYRNEDPDELARKAEGLLDSLVVEMQRRYRLDTESRTDILADHERFPTILVVADEIGILFELADKEWHHRKPEKYKGDTPCRELWHTLMRMGAEARVICMAANQTSSADEMPAGTKTRKLCGHRIVLGNTRDRNEWPMIAGDGMTKPTVPDGQKGAGVILVGTNSLPNRIQCANIDTGADPGAAYRLAVQGVEPLEEQGHIRDGQLYLGDVPLERPGRMGRQVAEHATHFSEGEAGLEHPDEGVVEQPAPESTEQGPEPSSVGSPPVPPIAGLAEAADFCGMNYRNFRRNRELHPIAGEWKVKNVPHWQRADLREWSMYRSENRKSNSGTKDRSA